MKYLITNPDSFGDMVLRQPLFKGLLDAGHAVGVLVKRSYSQIVHFLDPRLRIFMMDDMNPYVISILADKQKVDVALDQVEEFNPDVVVIAPYQRTVIDNWTLARFAHKRTIGMKGIEVVYENERRILRPVSIPVDVLLQVPENLSEVEKNKRLLALCLNKEVAEYQPCLQLPEATITISKTILKQLLLTPDRFIICAPASSNVLLKQYPLERYVRVLSFWAKKYKQSILLVGNEFEKNVVDTINDTLRDDSIDSRVWIGNETNLEVLLGLISQSRVYFGNDTGTMHFAATLGKPVIAIFGGGHWPRFLPTTASGGVILKELPCFGCGWQCIFEKALCIHSIDERRVIETVDKFEEQKLKPFKVLADPFEGDSVTAWIQDAKNALKGYKEQFDVLQISRDKEKTEFVLTRETLTKEANEAHKYVAKLRSELDEIYKKHSEKNQEIQQLQSRVHDQAERYSQEQRINQMYQSQLNEKDRKLGEQANQIQLLIQQHRKEVDVLRDEQKSLKQELETERQNSNKLRLQLRSREEAARSAIDGLIDIKPKLEEIHLSFRQQEEAIKYLENSLLGVIKSGWVQLGINIGIPWLSRWYRGLFERDKETGELIVLKPGYDNALGPKEVVLEKINKLLRIFDQSK